MNAQATVATAPTAEPHGAPQLRTILLTDLVDSTALVERLGDGAAAELFRAHDRLVLRLQNEWRGRLIDRSDGLLLLFERPVDGLGFALDYARGLRELGAPHDIHIKARAGLHVGEVLSWRNSDEAVRLGAKPVEVEGLAKPMAGRLMSMARPGQLLMSAVAEPLAHRAARELGERGQNLLWKSHGRWRFKGVPESQQIFEVGEPGITPLRAPQPSPKAWRDIPLWRRPAALAVELALVAAIGLGIWFTTRPQPAIAFNQRDWVVLADLRNLTGQPLLDDSLEQAFRISLEQSRHVNVLSDLKTRDTLARMQREPDTELDRAIASEIAIRDGARAVILPTVAEVGGRVRVSAEVIDPNSQTTVYAEYADGKGAVSALASIDEVTAALRQKLGEALEAVQRDSAPLPEVTTENLDALRAYALGQEAYAQARFTDAANLYQRAIELDPQFALAHIGIVRTELASADAQSAKEHLDRAMALPERLPEREAIYLEAFAAELSPGYKSPAKWKLLVELYPDYFPGAANYAATLMTENRFSEAEKLASITTASQNPLRAIGYDYLGRTQLAQGEYDQAHHSFGRAMALGYVGSIRRQASVMAAQFQLEEAEQLLRSSTSEAATEHLNRIAFAVDRGDLAAATEVVGLALQDPEVTGGLLERVIRVSEGSVALIDGDFRHAKALLAEAADNALKSMQAAEAADQTDDIYIALAAGFASLRAGDTATSIKVLRTLERYPDALAHPKAAELAELVRIKQSLNKSPAIAIRRLRTLVTGTELFQTHVVLLEAYATAEQPEAALAEARWLMKHRGLAYGEHAGGQVLQSLNVADTRVARLRAAELLVELGKQDAARREAEKFMKDWGATLPNHLRRRAESILPASMQ